MDKIEIKGLEVFAHHGVYEEEQRLGQKFVVSAVLSLDTTAAAQTDDLDKTVNYGAISKPWAPVGLPLETVAVETTRKWHTAYIALGSNLGEKKNYLDVAIEELKAVKGIEIESVSDWIETEPYGYLDQPNFLNGCACLRTWLEPFALLDVLQSIEAKAGRERKIHWGPRTLDLDLLFYDDQILGTKRLIVPHPEIEKRSFVLVPMAQIAPWLRHPVSKSTIKQLLEELNAEQ